MSDNSFLLYFPDVKDIHDIRNRCEELIRDITFKESGSVFPDNMIDTDHGYEYSTFDSSVKFMHDALKELCGEMKEYQYEVEPILELRIIPENNKMIEEYINPLADNKSLAYASSNELVKEWSLKRDGILCTLEVGDIPIHVELIYKKNFNIKFPRYLPARVLCSSHPGDLVKFTWERDGYVHEMVVRIS